MPRVVGTKRARTLRQTQTDVERLLWGRLRDHRLNGFKFKRRAPRGPFIVDFFCADEKLVVELDGSQHAMQIARDARRTKYLEAQGYRVLRFWNAQVNSTLDGVVATILAALERRL